MGRTHPHLDQPTPEALAALVADRPEGIRDAYLALHRVVVEAAPAGLRYSVDEVDRSIGYAARQYGYNGWGMVAVTPYAKWVAITFLDGKLLMDPASLLQGTAQMRHVRVTGVAAVREHEAELAGLVRVAVRLHLAPE